MEKNGKLLLLLNKLMLFSQCLPDKEKVPYDLRATDKGFEEYLKLLFANEAEHREESEAAVRTFIETGRFPEQSPWSAYITFLRFQCAAEFVAQLIAKDQSRFSLHVSRDTSDDVVLTWLLFDHWNRCFDVHLKLTAVSFYFSLPFYGL